MMVTVYIVPEARQIPSMLRRGGQFLLAIDNCFEIVSFEGMALACHIHSSGWLHTQQQHMGISDWS